MQLNEFIVKMMKSLGDFHQEWTCNNMFVNKEHYPMEMNFADWLEQFTIYDEAKDAKIAEIVNEISEDLKNSNNP